MQGYIYQTEENAKTARKQIADFYGLPANPDSITVYYVDYQYDEQQQFYYIIFKEGCREVFGEPIEFELSIPPLPQ